jgi:hypothetical protein
MASSLSYKLSSSLNHFANGVFRLSTNVSFKSLIFFLLAVFANLLNYLKILCHIWRRLSLKYAQSTHVSCIYAGCLGAAGVKGASQYIKSGQKQQDKSPPPYILLIHNLTDANCTTAREESMLYTCRLE